MTSMRFFSILVVAVLAAPPAQGATPKEGCAAQGKPKVLASDLTGPGTAYVVFGGTPYVVASSSKSQRVTLAPVPAGDVIEVTLPDGFDPKSWFGVGETLGAVGTGKGRKGVWVVKWGSPSGRAEATELSSAGNVVSGPNAAVLGDRVGVTWGEMAQGGKESQIVLAVLDGQSGAVVKSTMLATKVPWGGASARIAATTDELVVLQMQGDYGKERDYAKILKVARFTADLEPRAEPADLEKWKSIEGNYTVCDGRLYGVFEEMFPPRLVVRDLPSDGATSQEIVVLPKAENIRDVPTIACNGALPVVSWNLLVPPMPGPQSILVAQASRTPKALLIKKKAGVKQLDAMGFSRVVSAKDGLLVVWSEPRRGPNANAYNNDMKFDLMVQQLACSPK